ncbi:hypothetical protein I6M33_07680 [Shewanella algae]|uniref:hypothetical protein n=2 Tax=Shewanella algae TaxID=38313 RepID=UPI001DD8A463|nr:hypothetical protein [Shewanella algae]
MMDRTKSGSRLLIAEEKQALRCDMANLHLGQSRTKTSTSSKEQKIMRMGYMMLSRVIYF